MSSINNRIKALQTAERDYQRGLMRAHGQQRLEISGKLERIRRQIAMLTEDDRPPMGTPGQGQRWQ